MTAGAKRLADQHCAVCRPGAPQVSQDALQQFLSEHPSWQLSRQDTIPRLVRGFKYNKYPQAVAFVDRIAALAEEEDHHPAILLEWGKVTVSWWTHAIRGLHHNDLVMAAKTDQVYQEQPPG